MIGWAIWNEKEPEEGRIVLLKDDVFFLIFPDEESAKRVYERMEKKEGRKITKVDINEE